MTRISRFFMLGIPGTEPEEFIRFTKEYPVYGVVLFKRNFDNKEQLVSLINDIKNSGHNLVAVDHEGGRVQRFKEGFTIMPSFRNQVQNLSPKELFELHLQVNMELKNIGIDINLNPVADMIDDIDGVIGDRSAGTDIEVVERGVSAVIRGIEKAGLYSCVKHFPGHGLTKVDSHKSLPYSNKTLEELYQYEIQPFKKAARSRVSSIMLAHILFPKIDTVPASLSKIFVSEIRKNLYFSKPILTDDINMDAIENNYGFVDASILAIKAGVDVILSSSYDYNEIANYFDKLEKETELDSDIRTHLKSRKVFKQ